MGLRLESSIRSLATVPGVTSRFVSATHHVPKHSVEISISIQLVFVVQVPLRGPQVLFGCDILDDSLFDVLHLQEIGVGGSSEDWVLAELLAKVPDGTLTEASMVVLLGAIRVLTSLQNSNLLVVMSQHILVYARKIDRFSSSPGLCDLFGASSVSLLLSSFGAFSASMVSLSLADSCFPFSFLPVSFCSGGTPLISLSFLLLSDFFHGLKTCEFLSVFSLLAFNSLASFSSFSLSLFTKFSSARTSSMMSPSGSHFLTATPLSFVSFFTTLDTSTPHLGITRFASISSASFPPSVDLYVILVGDSKGVRLILCELEGKD